MDDERPAKPEPEEQPPPAGYKGVLKLQLAALRNMMVLLRLTRRRPRL